MRQITGFTMLEGCYSSLGILAALPVDVLKIDRGLIRNIHKYECKVVDQL